MFSTQKATTISDLLKRRFTGFNKILCSISLGTDSSIENTLEIELFNIESHSGTKEDNISFIEKLTFIRSFELGKIESAKEDLKIEIPNKKFYIVGALAVFLGIYFSFIY